MKRFALIVAGGSGLRMNSPVPKQFLLLHHKPVLMHTLQAFASWDAQCALYLALPQAQIEYWQTLCRQHLFTLPHTLVAGGDTRYGSVQNLLNKLNAEGAEGLAGVHDGVRPWVSAQTLQNVYTTALQKGNAVPVLPLAESLRHLGPEGSSSSVNRADYVSVQTPQVFELKSMYPAYATGYQSSFTDDAAVMEAAGHRIHLCAGNTENIKITYPQHLPA